MISDLLVQTQSRTEFRDITDSVQQAVTESGIQEGVCYLLVPHTTAAVTLNENWDPDVRGDLVRALADLVPDVPYRHSEGNSPAHLMSTLVGTTVTLFVRRGELLLGRWQGIYFAEFDGPRKRKVIVKVVADRS